MPGDIDTFALDRTRNYAEWLRFGATNIAQDARTLAFWAAKIVTKRPFATLAEEALDNAEKALTDAIQAIQEARKLYKSLPTKAPVVSDG